MPFLFCFQFHKSPDRVKPKTIKLVCDASPLSTPHSIKEKEQRLVGSKSGWWSHSLTLRVVVQIIVLYYWLFFLDNFRWWPMQFQNLDFPEVRRCSNNDKNVSGCVGNNTAGFIKLFPLWKFTDCTLYCKDKCYHHITWQMKIKTTELILMLSCLQ